MEVVDELSILEISIEKRTQIFEFLVPTLIVVAGQVTWALCKTVSSFVYGNKTMGALTTFRKFYQCVWDYDSRIYTL